MQQLICALPCYKVCCALPVVPIAYTPHSNLLSSHAPDDWVSFCVLQCIQAQSSLRCGVRSAVRSQRQSSRHLRQGSGSVTVTAKRKEPTSLYRDKRCSEECVIFIASLHGCSDALRRCCSRGRVYVPQRLAVLCSHHSVIKGCPTIFVWRIAMLTAVMAPRILSFARYMPQRVCTARRLLRSVDTAEQAGRGTQVDMAVYSPVRLEHCGKSAASAIFANWPQARDLRWTHVTPHVVS